MKDGFIKTKSSFRNEDRAGVQCSARGGPGWDGAPWWDPSQLPARASVTSIAAGLFSCFGLSVS